MNEILKYRRHAQVEDLQVGECTIHRASNSTSGRWWQLWFRVLRDTDGVDEVFCVPVRPNMTFLPNGPGGKTWGLNTKSGGSDWQISPSINVLGNGDAHEGQRNEVSIWHHTPCITDVPLGENWQSTEP